MTKITTPNGAVVHDTREARLAEPEGSYERIRPSYEELFPSGKDAVEDMLRDMLNSMSATCR